MARWLMQLFCWHEWRYFFTEPDYPELDYRKCGKKELTCI
jgi:hypothetical protein